MQSWFWDSTYLFQRLWRNIYLLPPLEEQNKIESLLSSIDSKINIETQYIKELKEQKTFLFQQMFV
ncbi:restriction endonuclease subunit S [Elizabethkingia bruuniana]|nr:restriction endonuclease subunit S [Elizabethkingia bruuniana]